LRRAGRDRTGRLTDETPELETIFAETLEPTHPLGVKAVAGVPMDGVAPAAGNAVLDAVGVNMDANPLTCGRCAASCFSCAATSASAERKTGSGDVGRQQNKKPRTPPRLEIRGHTAVAEPRSKNS